jgi:tRNA threonylcarbamoyladenosine biosynthesis protein TsaE
MVYLSYSSDETKKLGEKIAQKIAKDKTRKCANGAFVIALTGDLGSGKTTFVQGFLRGLGIKKRVTSPTFIIFRRFGINSGKNIRGAIREKNFKNVYHVDAYRLKKAKDLSVLGFKEILDDPRNIVLVEWAEKMKKILPRKALWIKFRHGKKENERKISP